MTASLLQALNDLGAKPEEESPTFKRVRQARRHELWQVAHSYDPDVAVRVICWFPAARGEALVDAWLRQKGSSDDRRS